MKLTTRGRSATDAFRTNVMREQLVRDRIDATPDCGYRKPERSNFRLERFGFCGPARLRARVWCSDERARKRAGPRRNFNFSAVGFNFPLSGFRYPVSGIVQCPRLLSPTKSPSWFFSKTPRANSC